MNFIVLALNIAFAIYQIGYKNTKITPLPTNCQLHKKVMGYKRWKRNKGRSSLKAWRNSQLYHQVIWLI